MNLKCKQLLGMALGLGLGLTGVTHAADVDVSDDISTSTTWTADNVYRLTKQIYVLPGATLTIEAGTLVQSQANLGGSLAVTRGAKIFVKGTKDAPVIMTSSNDTLNAWHEGVNEWGNLTVMGRALISGSHFDGSPFSYQVPADSTITEPPYGALVSHDNTKVPDGMNLRRMEGLTADDTGDPKVLYGGNNDDDDSGSIHYLSLRYGGKVIGLGDELNGMSMGGIGRETDVTHIDIMNNVDDGIETWGGTVNYKYIHIWNIGDDTFDIDQGWRGKGQFILIVQGYGTDASQGSGVGDNCFEHDGAEDSDAQPVTTATIYNATVIGQPFDGDYGTAWRDGARIQYRNCVFMDLGDDLVHNDGDDGDGASGYGHNGTLSFADVWTTPYTTHSAVNIGSADPNVLYQAQSAGDSSIGQGFLAEMTDSVFFNIADFGASDAVGVTAAGNASNPAKGNVVATAMPIKAITREAPVVRGGKGMANVIALDPRAANDAVTSVAMAPADGFFTPVKYRGAFSKDVNWAKGWTAASAYGYYAEADSAAAPETTVALATTVTSFESVNGVVYTVEASADGLNFSPVTVIVGDGSTKSIATELGEGFSASMLYRVIAQ
ncbi:hypothetical protein HED60_13045 [Planctomycetales bacterium ZRK34]|nr:hypothetical protein HED60_13045 [Planctomycetales bacterium ZRK34]